MFRSQKDDCHHKPLSSLMSKDFVSLKDDMLVSDALDFIRDNSTDDKIVYYYVTDYDDVLTGVVSTRKLLTAPLEQKIKDIKDTRVRYVPTNSTVIDLWELFIFHKYLAMPVVDKNRKLVGIVDITLFTDSVLDIIEREQTDDIFETIGFKLSQVRNASSLKVFRYRFPWLTATIISGIISAIMVSKYELVLSHSIILAFFLTLVLGLGESVSMQSMTVTLQGFRNITPTLGWYIRALFREIRVAFLLGLGSGILVFSAIMIWQGSLLIAAVIGGSIVLSLTVACLIGLTIPAMLHLMKLDLKIASGPLTLALADIFTIIIYFGIAAYLL